MDQQGAVPLSLNSVRVAALFCISSKLEGMHVVLLWFAAPDFLHAVCCGFAPARCSDKQWELAVAAWQIADH